MKGYIIRRSLGTLLSLLALGALAGGIYGLVGAPGIPVAWLAGSPFANYFVPSLILVVLVGGSLALAAVAMFERHPRAFELAAMAGAILLCWITIQHAAVRKRSWRSRASSPTASSWTSACRG